MHRNWHYRYVYNTTHASYNQKASRLAKGIYHLHRYFAQLIVRIAMSSMGCQGSTKEAYPTVPQRQGQLSGKVHFCDGLEEHKAVDPQQ